MKVRTWIWRRRGQTATLGATLTLASFSVLRQPYAAIVFCIGLVLGLLALRIEEARLDRADELAAELNSARDDAGGKAARLGTYLEDARLAIDEVLVALIRHCEADLDNVRATVYLRREQDWVRLARYSSNAAFRESGRTSIPLGSGLLQRALERSTAEANDLPDRERAPAQYEREQIRLGLLADQCSMLRMPSRSYALFRIEGAVTARPRKTFILCIESTDPRGAVRGALSDAIGNWIPLLHRIFARSPESV